MGVSGKPPVSIRLIRYVASVPWARRCYAVIRQKTVPASALLLGGDNGLNPNGYAQTMNRLLWTSTPIEESPHARLLKLFAALGEDLFAPGRLQETEYFQNAVRNLEMFGIYYGARSQSELVGWIRSFTGRLNAGSGAKDKGISVKAVEGTRCFQIAEDPHTVALALAAGQRNFRVSVARKQTRTALQELLERVLWFNGNRELYQPIEAPEIRDSWFLTRKCTDRLVKMQGFLRENGIGGGGAAGTYLDIGSFYGWFVQKMVEFGLDGRGIERDPIATAVGVGCYGLAPERVQVGDVANWLEQSPSKYDVVSCLSVLHHFVLDRQKISAEAFIRRLAEKVGRVLFLDMGQEHENLSGGKLAGWNPDFIEKWVLSHTDFKRAVRLGTDEDAQFPHERDYGRMLFAFVR